MTPIAQTSHFSLYVLLSMISGAEIQTDGHFETPITFYNALFLALSKIFFYISQSQVSFSCSQPTKLMVSLGFFLYLLHKQRK